MRTAFGVLYVVGAMWGAFVLGHDLGAGRPVDEGMALCALVCGAIVLQIVLERNP